MGEENKGRAVTANKGQKRPRKVWRMNRQLSKENRKCVLNLLQRLSSPQKKAFLSAYVEQGGIRRASEVSGIEWRNHYNWMKADEDYREDFGLAKELFTDFMEEEIVRRGFKGVDRPIIYQGKLKKATYKEYSDNLLMFEMKKRRSEYRDSSGININTPIAITFLKFGEDEQEVREVKDVKILEDGQE